MENIIGKLLQDYEHGRMTRRQLYSDADARRDGGGQRGRCGSRAGQRHLYQPRVHAGRGLQEDARFLCGSVRDEGGRATTARHECTPDGSATTSSSPATPASRPGGKVERRSHRVHARELGYRQDRQAGSGERS